MAARTYRLTVPANAPVKQYWSATVYDRATHALIRDMTRPVARRYRRDCRKTPTGRSTSTSGRRPPQARRPTGFPRAPMEASKFCSASTAPRRRCSRRPGSCRTSRKSNRGGTNLKVSEPACYAMLSPHSAVPVTVTAENFARAESDLYFGGVVKDGALRQVPTITAS